MSKNDTDMEADTQEAIDRGEELAAMSLSRNGSMRTGWQAGRQHGRVFVKSTNVSGNCYPMGCFGSKTRKQANVFAWSQALSDDGMSSSAAMSR